VQGAIDVVDDAGLTEVTLFRPHHTDVAETFSRALHCV
jgi:hypothetical protein